MYLFEFQIITWTFVSFSIGPLLCPFILTFCLILYLDFSIWTFFVSFSVGPLFISIRLFVSFSIGPLLCPFILTFCLNLVFCLFLFGPSLCHFLWAFIYVRLLVSSFYWTFIVSFILTFCLILYFAFFYFDLLWSFSVGPLFISICVFSIGPLL